MSFSTLFVDLRTRRVIPTQSTVTNVILLSSFTSSFEVTVQDTYGLASASNPILVSTTRNVYFNALPNQSTFTLTQPYSFLSLSAESPTLWRPLHSFALPSTQAVYSVSSFNVSTLVTSTGTAFTQALTGLRLNHILASTVHVEDNATVLTRLQVNSNVFIQSTATTQFLSTTNIFAQSSISTIGPLSVYTSLTANSGVFQSSLRITSNAIFQSLSTQTLSVQRNALVSSATVFRLQNLSVVSTIALETSSITASNVTFFGPTTVTSLYTSTNPGSLLVSTANLQSLLTPSLTIGAFPLTIVGPANFSSNFIAQSVANVSDSVIALNATITALQASTISSSSTLTVNSNALFRLSTATTHLSSISQTTISSAVYTSTITNFPTFAGPFQMDILGNLNASTTFLQGGSTLSVTPNNFTILNLCNVFVNDTVNIRSQSFAFNDIIGVLNSLIPRTTNLFWSATGFYPNASFTGQYMLCANDNSNLYFTSNFGSNFSPVVSTLAGGLVKDAQISGSGLISALTYGTTNFTWSANSGATWFTKTITTAGSRTLTSGDAIALSFGGDIQLLAGRTTPAPTQNNLLVSSNFGNTWTSVFNQGSASAINWSSAAISSNGQYMVAVASNTRIFLSSNTGTSWTQVGPLTNLVWSGIAMSYTGQYMTATASNSFVYTSSNFGSNWTARDSVRTWGKVSMSASGQFQVASANALDRFFYSYDYGVTWSPRLVFGVNTVRGVAISKSNVPVFLVAPAFGPVYTGSSSMNFRSAVDVSGNVTVTGTLSKAAGSFEVQHPLDSNKLLVHSFLEAPRADLVYRGIAILDANGCATVDLNTDATGNGTHMSPKTFESLARNPQVFLRNNTTSARLKGSVKGPFLTIVSHPPATNIRVDWMVIAERGDPSIRKWRRVDKQGYLVLESPSYF